MAVKEYTIVIDPGHGGKDPGCVNTIQGRQEKVVNLAVAKLVAAKLLSLYNKEYKIAPVLTRETDIFIPLDKRTKPTTSGLCIFVSIHSNSCERDTPHGLQVYYKRNCVASQTLAANLLCRCAPVLRLSKWNRADPATFTVLKTSKCPAVLIELGFLSNQIDCRELNNLTTQVALADGIVEAVIRSIVPADIAIEYGFDVTGHTLR